MNKNLNNHQGKGNKKDQTQHHENRYNGTKSSSEGGNLNRDQQPVRVKSFEKETVSERNSPGMESRTMKSTSLRDGSPSFQKQHLNPEPGNKASAFQTNNVSQNGGGKAKDVGKEPVSGTVLYAIAAILLVAWAIGFFYFNSGTMIHVLLVLALIAVLMKVAQVKNY